MRLFFKRTDGGPESNVTGWWLIEWKAYFSIVLLRFGHGSREAYHSHAFNALTWFLTGSVLEQLLDGTFREWTPSIKPKFTPRSCFHRVHGIRTCYALSFRGPWSKTWKEYRPAQDKTVTLTNGRVEIPNA